MSESRDTPLSLPVFNGKSHLSPLSRWASCSVMSSGASWRISFTTRDDKDSRNSKLASPCSTGLMTLTTADSKVLSSLESKWRRGGERGHIFLHLELFNLYFHTTDFLLITKNKFTWLILYVFSHFILINYIPKSLWRPSHLSTSISYLTVGK